MPNYQRYLPAVYKTSHGATAPRERDDENLCRFYSKMMLSDKRELTWSGWQFRRYNLKEVAY
jgi:hypothetical protein